MGPAGRPEMPPGWLRAETEATEPCRRRVHQPTAAGRVHHAALGPRGAACRHGQTSSAHELLACELAAFATSIGSARCTDHRALSDELHRLKAALLSSGKPVSSHWVAGKLSFPLGVQFADIVAISDVERGEQAGGAVRT